MKDIDERLISKNLSSKGPKSIAKHTTEPRGITLRSRKVEYL
jgi:hypothetical protein